MSYSNFEKPLALPPMEQGGMEDISSFVGLELALRSSSELVREGSHSLSPKSLSLLTAGMRWFQEVHLGKDAKGLKWPIVRIPDSIFLDRNRGGPLFTALLSAFRHKSTQSWRTFDFKNPKRYDDNISLFKRMERDLIAAGHLNRPTIYIDESVPKRYRSELEGIALRFGATLVRHYEKASHIVGYDDEEMDTEDEILKEEERTNNGDSPDRTYLRTVAVIDANTKTDSNANSSDLKSNKAVKNSHQNLHPHPMALVHWWFWPTSADEWIPAADVDGVPENEEPPRGPNGAWIVSCKFIRDVLRFNEWGLEADYVIMDFEKKIDLYKNPELNLANVSNSGTNVDSKQSGSKVVGDSSTNFQDEKTDEVPSGSSSSIRNRSSIVSKVKSSSGAKHERRMGNGMNPRLINIGEMSAKGDKYKVMVFDGALRVPSLSKEITQKFTMECERVPSSKFDPAVKTLEVLAPSMDPSLPSITVTELSRNMANIDSTVAINYNILKQDSLERIRGGGVEEKEEGGEENEGEGKSGKDECLSNSDTSLMTVTKGSALSQHRKTHSNAPPDSNTSTKSKTCDASKQSPTTSVQVEKSNGLQLFNESSELPSAEASETMQPSIISNTIASTKIVSNSLTSVDENTNLNLDEDMNSTHIPSSQTKLETISSHIIASAASTAAQIVKHQQANKLLGAIQPQTSMPAPSLPLRNTNVTIHHNPPKVLSSLSDATNNSKVSPPSKKQLPLSSPLTARLLSSVTNLNASSQQKNYKPKNIDSKNVSYSSTEKLSSPPTLQMNPSIPVSLPQSNQLKSSVNKTNILNQSTQSTQSTVLPSSTPLTQAVTNNLETISQKPEWYRKDSPSSVEKMMLPEWFDNSASHRTPSNYIKIREGIVSMAEQTPNRFITATSVRKKFAGDAGSLLRLHSFLVAWGFINIDAVGDSMPISAMVSNEARESSSLSRFTSTNKTQVNSMNQNCKVTWTEYKKRMLAQSVVTQMKKKRKIIGRGIEEPEDEHDFAVDWNAVAMEVGGGCSANECETEFLSMPLDDNIVEHDKNVVSEHLLQKDKVNLSPSSFYDQENLKEEFIRELVGKTRPEIIRGALNGALKVSDNFNESKNAATLAGIAVRAVEEARNEEEVVNKLLLEILDQRMLKLENRMSLLDDVEAMLDVERTTLELERRDLYTARCRYWLGNGTGIG